MSDEPVVQLETMTIIDSFWRRDLQRKMRDNKDAAAAAEFKWNRGGLITTKQFAKLQADIGVWPKLFEREHGAWSAREIILKIDVLNLRW